MTRCTVQLDDGMTEDELAEFLKAENLAAAKAELKANILEFINRRWPGIEGDGKPCQVVQVKLPPMRMLSVKLPFGRTNDDE